MNNKNENAEKDLNELQRIIYLFINPFKAMADIVKRPGFLIPILFILMVPVMSLALMYDIQLQESIKAIANQMSKLGIEMTMSQIQQQATSGMMITFPLSAIQSIISWFFISAIILFLVKFFGAQENVTLKKILSINGYTYIIGAVGIIIVAVVTNRAEKYGFSLSLLDLYAKGKEIDLMKPSYINTVLSSLSLFEVWRNIVLAIGINKAAKFSSFYGFLIVILIFLFKLGFSIISVTAAMKFL